MLENTLPLFDVIDTVSPALDPSPPPTGAGEAGSAAHTSPVNGPSDHLDLDGPQPRAWVDALRSSELSPANRRHIAQHIDAATRGSATTSMARAPSPSDNNRADADIEDWKADRRRQSTMNWAIGGVLVLAVLGAWWLW